MSSLNHTVELARLKIPYDRRPQARKRWGDSKSILTWNELYAEDLTNESMESKDFIPGVTKQAIVSSWTKADI